MGLLNGWMKSADFPMILHPLRILIESCWEQGNYEAMGDTLGIKANEWYFLTKNKSLVREGQRGWKQGHCPMYPI